MEKGEAEEGWSTFDCLRVTVVKAGLIKALVCGFQGRYHLHPHLQLLLLRAEDSQRVLNVKRDIAVFCLSQSQCFTIVFLMVDLTYPRTTVAPATRSFT